MQHDLLATAALYAFLSSDCKASTFSTGARSLDVTCGKNRGGRIHIGISFTVTLKLLSLD
jgi:hypothetical protein